MGLEEKRKLKELQEVTSCHRTNMALRGICADDVGKQAVRDGLRVIRDGVPEMHCAYARRTDGMFSDREIEKVPSTGL